MQKEYEARSATTANNLQLLKNQMSRLAITVGNALLPAFNSLAGALMKPIEGLTALAERFPIVTQVVVGTVGAVLGLKVAAIALGYAWTFVKGPILAAHTAIQSVRAGLALLRVQTAATAASSGLLALAWQRLQTGALGLIAPIRAAALAFWGMLPAIGATTAALLANPITWIVAGIGAAVAGLALLIRKYWQPLAAWIGGFWEGIKAGAAPAIEAIGQALAPLAPVGEAIAAVFDRVAGAFSAALGWVSALLAPIQLTQDEFSALAASGRSVGAVVGSVLGAAFTALTLPLQGVAALIDLVGQGLAKIGQAADWVAGKLQSFSSVGASVKSFFDDFVAGAKGYLGLDKEEDTQSKPATARRPNATGRARPAPVTPAPLPAAQPVARSSTVATTLQAPITIHAPAGADAREIADLVDARLRRLLAEQNRNPRALYD